MSCFIDEKRLRICQTWIRNGPSVWQAINQRTKMKIRKLMSEESDQISHHHETPHDSMLIIIAIRAIVTHENSITSIKSIKY